MAKKRKTRKEKIVAAQRREKEGFVIQEGWLKTPDKKAEAQTINLQKDKKYFQADLTKTLLLTMLVLALELALWQYLSKL